MKTTKSVVSREYHGLRICGNAFAAGDPPRTHWGSLQRASEPLAVFRGGKVERKGKGRRRKGTEGKGMKREGKRNREEWRKGILYPLAKIPAGTHELRMPETESKATRSKSGTNSETEARIVDSNVVKMLSK